MARVGPQRHRKKMIIINCTLINSSISNFVESEEALWGIWIITKDVFSINKPYVLLKFNTGEYRKCQTVFSETFEVWFEENFV